MGRRFVDILKRVEEGNSILDREDIVALLGSTGEDRLLLLKRAEEVKQRSVGNRVYFRGLIELSNICEKSCLYCGIRRENRSVNRYNLSDSEVLEAAEFAWKSNYGSIAIQAGELSSDTFTTRIENLLKEIKLLSRGELGITLSLGEQSTETYQKWFKAGGHRYLLRIESSNRDLYKKIHPDNELHSYSRRIDALSRVKSVGYQTGTGVMIALPDQNLYHLADDILFMKRIDIDMVGMGPYLEHKDTPMYSRAGELIPKIERFNLTLNMIAVLRLVMPYINIAAATALQAIDPIGREKAVQVGANIIMPNITPGVYRNNYSLYQNKPCVDEEPNQCKGCLDARIGLAKGEIAYGEWGDSIHFKRRV